MNPSSQFTDYYSTSSTQGYPPYGQFYTNSPYPYRPEYHPHHSHQHHHQANICRLPSVDYPAVAGGPPWKSGLELTGDDKLLPNPYMTTSPVDSFKLLRGCSSQEKLSPHSIYLGQQRTKNEALAESLGLPKQDVDKIVNLPMDEFATFATNHNFNEEQMNVLRDIRRRGKNLVAAHNCRRRKIDEIEDLKERLKKVQRDKQRNSKKKLELLTEKEVLAKKMAEVEISTLKRFDLDPSVYRLKCDEASGTLQLAYRT